MWFFSGWSESCENVIFPGWSESCEDVIFSGSFGEKIGNPGKKRGKNEIDSMRTPGKWQK
jgi:hypothetical protein